MAGSAPAAVLVLAGDEAFHQRLAGMSDDAGLRVWRRVEDVPADVKLDVIVTNQPIGSEVLAARPEQPARGDVGVVSVGCGGPADVWLAPDATAREVALACRLLGEIVRLRRRARAATRLRKVLSRLAMADPLTGLPNRRAWQRELERRCETAASCGQTLCLAILDLDHFKQLNDSRGHAAGDKVLRQAGEALRRGLRQSDFLARLGGDEYGLLLWDAGAQSAAVVDRVRRALPAGLAAAALPPVQASAGYTLLSPGSDITAEALFAAADEALRAAKNRGRDRTVAAHDRDPHPPR